MVRIAHLSAQWKSTLRVMAAFIANSEEGRMRHSFLSHPCSWTLADAFRLITRSREILFNPSPVFRTTAQKSSELFNFNPSKMSCLSATDDCPVGFIWWQLWTGWYGEGFPQLCWVSPTLWTMILEWDSHKIGERRFELQLRTEAGWV